MNRAILVLVAGTVCGVLAYFGWYAVNRPAWATAGDPQIGWMRDSLKLTPQQFERIKELHEQSRPHMMELAAEVAQLRAQFAEFEREQKETENVDFVAFAGFVQRRRTVDAECLASTRQLVLAASAVMDARQRERYRALVEPVLRHAGKDDLN